MPNKSRVMLDVLSESITLGGRVPLPPGRYEGTVLYADGIDDTPVGTVLMATLDIDAETATRVGASFLVSTASISINVTRAIADGKVVIGENIKAAPPKLLH